MGLAASQARLLTITARKADCEFQSMTLSHQKLALSRNMEAVSEEYQKALSATKLVYDYQATGTSNMNLTYDLLMSPSIYNDYYPKLVTDAKNRCILNSAYAAAARAAGIPAEGLLGTPSSDIRNKFIQALANNNVITAYSAASIQAVTYGNTVGLGETISATQGIEEMSYEQLLERLKASSVSSADYGFTLGLDYESAMKAEFGNDTDLTPDKGEDGQNLSASYPSRYWDGERLRYYENGSLKDNYKGQGSSFALTITDLLDTSKNYVYALETARGHSGPILDAAYMQQHLIGDQFSFLNWIDDQFYNVLGGTPASETALQYAYDVIYDLVYPNSNIQNLCNEHHIGKGTQHRSNNSEIGNDTAKNALAQIGTCTYSKKDDGSKIDSTANKAINYIGATYAQKGDNDEGDWSSIAIDLSSLTQIYLTAYVEYMQGVDKTNFNYEIGKKADKGTKLYNPEKNDFTFQVAGNSEVDDGGSDLNASFYDALFNMICTQGWTENAQIDDTDYMTEMMKNGMAFISSISDDGYYYQSAYSNDKTILEVADEESIAQAEAKYNAEKAKIENKEDSIDMKMKGLDTELSALDQEYNTVKSLITKSVEKSFKRYEA